jgi:hypothetical protein
MKLQENMQDIISNAKIFEKLCWVRDLIWGDIFENFITNLG